MARDTSLMFRTLIILCITVFSQYGLADTDESWNQVFNFQLKLAEQGNVKAQYILGEMYEQGRGTEKDLDTAILWYKKAEANGSKKAAGRIARIKENIRLQALEKVRAEEEKQRLEAEKVRQLALQKQQAEQARARAEAERIREEKQARIRAEEQAKQKEEEAKLSPEERAKKIKEAQEKAQAIAKQNALRQQQAADVALEKYRASLNKSQATSSKPSSNAKYQDAFE